jgi:hypothetical protein
MTDTANLGLPCIEGSQAQKHVTHNDALRMLDTLVQLAVLDRDLTAPPGSPAEGQRWIVKPAATGAWTGHNNAIAAWQDGVWQFSVPQAGWIAFVVDEGTLVAWDGSAWGDFFSTVTSLQNLAMLGIGTTADTTNRVSAKLNNALWTAKTVAEGGDGNLRYKLSKESSAKTLSLLMQDNFSGRAEIGLTGDDDLHLKVSPDGTTWYEGIKIAAATGVVTFPNTTIAGGREILAANRTYYVRTDGSNSNNGLANTSGGAWLTPQKAMDVIAGTLDLAGFTVTVQLGDGTYTSGVSLKPWVGGGALVFQGNHTTPANVFISPTSADCFQNKLGALPGTVTIKDMKLGTTTGYCMVCAAPCTVAIDNVNFAAATIHLVGYTGVTIDISRSYTISGGASVHWYSGGALFSNMGATPTITLTGTPTFGAFANANSCGFIFCGGHVFNGVATGSHYSATLNGVINTTSGGANFLPGNSTGSTATGGQYV